MKPFLMTMALVLVSAIHSGCGPTNMAASKPSLDSSDPKERLRAIKAAGDAAENNRFNPPSGEHP